MKNYGGAGFSYFMSPPKRPDAIDMTGRVALWRTASEHNAFVVERDWSRFIPEAGNRVAARDQLEEMIGSSHRFNVVVAAEGQDVDARDNIGIADTCDAYKAAVESQLSDAEMNDFLSGHHDGLARYAVTLRGGRIDVELSVEYSPADLGARKKTIRAVATQTAEI